MRVAFHAVALDQGDRSADLFAKAVPDRRGDGGDQRRFARRLFFYCVDAGHAGSGLVSCPENIRRSADQERNPDLGRTSSDFFDDRLDQRSGLVPSTRDLLALRAHIVAITFTRDTAKNQSMVF